MEEKKNKKYIIMIVILVILLLGSIGYIVYDKFIKEDEIVENNENQNNDSNNNNQDNESNNEEENKWSEEDIAIIRNDLHNIFDCTNGAKMCDELMWYTAMIPSIDENENYDFFELAAPFIMKYFHDFEFETASWYYGGIYLVSDQDLETFNEYFNINFNYEEYDGLYGFGTYENLIKECENTELYGDNCKYLEDYNKYANKGYKIAAIIGDGFGSHGTEFEIETITKNTYNDKYTVSVLVKPNELLEDIIDEKIEIHTKVEVEIVDEHPRYGSMMIESV